MVVEQRTGSARAHGIVVREEETHITGGHKYLKYVFTDEYIKPGNLSLSPFRQANCGHTSLESISTELTAASGYSQPSPDWTHYGRDRIQNSLSSITQLGYT